MSRLVSPGGTIGVLGGGQLGRMMALAAHEMGYRVHVFTPEAGSPLGQIADRAWVHDWSDDAPLRAFASAVDVVTYEFENIPIAAARLVAEQAPVFPRIDALATAQHRGREKQFLRDNGIPVAPFSYLQTAADLPQAFDGVRTPAILKTAAGGYDGKGQVRILSGDDLPNAWRQLGERPAVLEQFVEFEREVSVVGARSATGECVFYGPVANDHANHILDVSQCPASVPPSVVRQAIEITRTVLVQLDVVGVLCVEFFLDARGELLVNEIAPRPHNSGHLTIDAHLTSQFEQQVRAVCGLKLGSAEQWRPAAMANLLGDLWSAGPPHWSAALEMEGVKLHLYGKHEPRIGRKMGHLTAFGATAEQARERVIAARRKLVS